MINRINKNITKQIKQMKKIIITLLIGLYGLTNAQVKIGTNPTILTSPNSTR